MTVQKLIHKSGLSYQPLCKVDTVNGRSKQAYEAGSVSERALPVAESKSMNGTPNSARSMSAIVIT